MKRKIFEERNLPFKNGTFISEDCPISYSKHIYGHDEIILSKEDIENLIIIYDKKPLLIKIILENWYLRFNKPILQEN